MKTIGTVLYQRHRRLKAILQQSHTDTGHQTQAFQSLYQAGLLNQTTQHNLTYVLQYSVPFTKYLNHCLVNKFIKSLFD